MRIGVPSEVKNNEFRVAITPSGVHDLTAAGHEVLIQSGAGLGSSITDEDYRNRERWDEYVDAVDQMVLRTTADRAPWHVIAANDKLYARVATLKAVNKGLKRVLRDS